MYGARSANVIIRQIEKTWHLLYSIFYNKMSSYVVDISQEMKRYLRQVF